ncbi:MAG: MarR family transcriptional regulator [Frankiales bacterium]|nr:MAG: MarR family transcriptional regulator [Frankiales bacterium]
MPTISDPALASALRLAVMRLARRMRAERPESDLSLTQLSALAVLERQGPLTPRELAAAERIRPPSMTRVVAALEAAGLVTRTDHPTDGRQVLLAASPAGAALLREDRRRREAWLAQRLRDLDADDREVLRRAAAVLDRLAGS